jgi:hypothetical protein
VKEAATLVDIVSPTPRAEWVKVLADDPNATVYQTPTWLEAALRASGGVDVSRLYRLSDGRQLVLPMLRRTRLPGLWFDDAYPGLGSGGLLASEGLRSSDVQLVLTDTLDSPAASTRIKANHDTTDTWEAGLIKGVNHFFRRVEILDLRGGYSEVWEQRFRSSARRAIRKAERAEVEVEKDTSSQAVRTFYDLYLTWTDQRAEESGVPKWLARSAARRREPLKRFEAIATMTGDMCRIWVARYRDEPIASIITLVFGRHAVYWRGCSNKALAGPLRANNLLQHFAIEDACLAGCQYYSFGESGGVTSLIHFKETFGATPRRAIEVRLERPWIAQVENANHRLMDTSAMLLNRVRR